MVTVQLRFLGWGCWQPMTLPVSPQVAQTLVAAARGLKLAEQVQISPNSTTQGLVDRSV
jgi:hypothetical protein